MTWRTALALLALIGFGFGCIEIGKDLKQGQWDADNLTKAEKRAAEMAQAEADLQAKNDQIHKQAQEHADEEQDHAVVAGPRGPRDPGQPGDGGGDGWPRVPGRVRQPD